MVGRNGDLMKNPAFDTSVFDLGKDERMKSMPSVAEDQLASVN